MKRLADRSRSRRRILALALCMFAAVPLASCDTSSVEPLDTTTLLSVLVLSSGTLSPVFTPTNLTYTASVTNATTSITLTPTASAAGSTIKVNGVTVASGATTPAINLSTGLNAITITVTSASTGKSSTYLISVTRASS